MIDKKAKDEDMEKATRMIARHFISKFDEHDALSVLAVHKNTEEIEIGRAHRLWLKLLRKPIPRRLVLPKISGRFVFKRPDPFKDTKE